MTDFDDDKQTPEDSARQSKSERKREMLALQKLGEALTKLNAEQWQQFPLNNDIVNALTEFQRITHLDARRRQIRFIGKLLRKVDADAVREIHDRLTAPQREDTYRHHLCESWRQRLLTEGHQAITAFIDDYPAVERQEFRQLVHKAQKEQQQQKPPRESRRLFQFIRRTIDDADSER